MILTSVNRMRRFVVFFHGLAFYGYVRSYMLITIVDALKVVGPPPQRPTTDIVSGFER